MRPINAEIIESFNYLIEYTKTIDTNDINQIIRLFNDIEGIKESLNAHIIALTEEKITEETIEENTKNKLDFISAIDELNKEREEL